MTPYDPLTLLLIEDNLDDERIALRALRGCRQPLLVRVARDGACARRLLGMDGTGEARPPGLVITDLKLPGLHGDELVRLARQDGRLADVPFVVFSSSREPDDVARCLDHGATAYVQKPVGYDEYLNCLTTVVRWALDGFRKADQPSCAICGGLRVR